MGLFEDASLVESVVRSSDVATGDTVTAGVLG